MHKDFYIWHKKWLMVFGPKKEKLEVTDHLLILE